MNAVGIDVSSRKSTVAVLRPLGEVVCLPFDVTHDIAGLASLAEKLKALDGETRVVMEHTGRYYEAVAKALHEAGLFVCAVNPLLIKEYGANSLRRVKTDKADAVKIARYALDMIILLVLLFAVLCIRLLFFQFLIEPVIILAVLFDIIQCFVRFYIIFFKVVSLSAHAQTAGQGCR